MSLLKEGVDLRLSSFHDCPYLGGRQVEVAGVEVSHHVFYLDVDLIQAIRFAKSAAILSMLFVW